MMKMMMERALFVVVLGAAALSMVSAVPQEPAVMGEVTDQLVNVFTTATPVEQTTEQITTAEQTAVVTLDTTPAVTGSMIPGQCSIIFDFDGVVKIYQDQFDNDRSIGANAREVFQLVKERNLNMGIATMSCEWDFIRKYLKQNFDTEIFFDEFLFSENVQFCEPKKSIQMQKIINNLGGDMNCAILYDDSIGNKEDVIDAGHIYQLVDRYVGITSQDFEDGLAQLRARGTCNC